MMMKNIISVVVGTLIGLTTLAQEYKGEAKLDAVSETAYYRIVLSAELLGQLRDDYADLRIIDNTGNEIAYIKKEEKAVASTSLFKEYEILEKMFGKDTISHLIFHNPNREKIDNVSFIVKNTDVQKRARLSGSNDQENWYVIKNNYLLHSMVNEDETQEFKILNFPLSDYEYFKLEVNDNKKLPINIVKVGYYDTQKTKGISTYFNCPIVEMKDSAKSTFLKVEFPQSMFIERLSFQLSGTEYYSRNAQIWSVKKYLNRKKKKVVRNETIASVHLNSNTTNDFSIRSLSLKDFYVKINNRDDHPLTIEGITASYLNKYVVAELKAGEEYFLKFGNDKVSAPVYDLEKFQDKISISPTKVNHQGIDKIKQSTEKKASSLWNSPAIVWTVIIVVGGFIAFISFKVINEMSNKQ